MDIEFRVKEYDGLFQIQRKQITEKSTGWLWWKKTTKETRWKGVDKRGNCLFSVGYPIFFNNYDQRIKPFEDLQSALDQIKIMVSGAKYHYRK